MADMGVFDKVRELRRQGKTPTIQLLPGAQIHPPKRPRGRPRQYPEDSPIASRYAGRRGKNRPRCMANGCDRKLKKTQLAACSPACADRIVNDAILRLRQCGVTKDELMKIFPEDDE